MMSDDPISLLHKYQMRTFASILKWVIGVCSIMTGAYFVSFLRTTETPSLVMSVGFAGMTSVSIISYHKNSHDQYSSAIGIFISSASVLVFLVYLFHPPELVLIGALGSSIIVIAVLYLETEKNAIFWIAINIIILFVVGLIRQIWHVPYVELGGLAWVMQYIVPTGVLIILAILGLHTIQQLKSALTESEFTRTQLERSNKELENFAYITSHDLQEPLRKINAFGERILDKAGDQLDERNQDYLARMISASTRMQTLINDLLTYSRLGTHQQPHTEISLSTCVDDVLDELDYLIEEKKAQITLDVLPIIHAEALHMKQLFRNLIHNALKYSKADVPPHIHIKSTMVDTQTIKIEIIDNGIGFDEKYLDKIFGIFQRLHNRSAYPGTGIGLAICQRIVIQHQGHITAESKPGVGARFIVLLPVKDTGD